MFVTKNKGCNYLEFWPSPSFGIILKLLRRELQLIDTKLPQRTEKDWLRTRPHPQKMESPEKVSKVGTNKKKLEYVSVIQPLFTKKEKRHTVKNCYVFQEPFFCKQKTCKKQTFEKPKKGLTYYEACIETSSTQIKLLFANKP